MVVTKEQIEEWKKQYGKVYRVNVNGLEVIYRLLTRNDYVQIIQKQSLGLIEDTELETFNICVLSDISDEDVNSVGGIVTVVSDDIMKRSGFVQVESEEL